MGDIRWEIEPRKIRQISLRPNQPPMYLVDGIDNAAYTKNQLQVVSDVEKPPPKEAVKKFIVEKLIDDKKIKNKIHYLVKWKNFTESNNTWEPKDNIPKEFIDEYKKK